MSDDGYLSRNREHLARQQRERRARMVRIDYMPGTDALAAIEAKRTTLPGWNVLSTNSAIIDAIVTEWAALTGIKYKQESKPKTSGASPELRDGYAHAHMSSECLPELRQPSRAGAGARMSLDDLPALLLNIPRKPKPPQRVTCGARRHRDGQPCQALSEPGKRRCRFHGGRSTGPRTPEGKARALANLRGGRKSDNCVE